MAVNGVNFIIMTRLALICARVQFSTHLQLCSCAVLAPQRPLVYVLQGVTRRHKFSERKKGGTEGLPESFELFSHPPRLIPNLLDNFLLEFDSLEQLDLTSVSSEKSRRLV